MKAKLVRSVKKVAAVATGALFIGATMGMASVFAQGLSSLPGPFVSHGAVNAVVVVGASAAPSDILGSIDIASALTAAAAATHSSTGSFVTIGVSSVVSKASSTGFSNVNGTALGTFSPSSVNVVAPVRFMSANKINYTSIENVTFTKKPTLDGLNVVLPAGAFELSSYIVNRSSANTTISLTTGDSYLVGTSSQSLLSLGTGNANATFGTSQTITNVPVPSTKTFGTNTVAFEGLVKTTTNTGATYQLELKVNALNSTYINLSSSDNKIGPITISVGKLITDINGSSYLNTVSVSSTAFVQNTSAAANSAFGLPAGYNVTIGTKFINFTYEKAVPFNYSFKNTSSFDMASGLPSLSLEPLTANYTSTAGASNITVTTSKGAIDTYVPTAVPTPTDIYSNQFTYTANLPNVFFGTDFRGPLSSTTYTYGGPDLLLEGFQSVRNLSSGLLVNASSEYIFPYTLTTHYYTNSTPGTVNFSVSGPKGVVRLVYELPNGKDFAIQFTKVAGGSAVTHYVYNATTLYNYTASTTGSPVISTVMLNHPYDFGGYNLTFKPFTVYINGTNVDPQSVANFTLKGPVAGVSNGYSFVPGYSGLYATNGTRYSTVNVAEGLGTLSFSNNDLVYTDPIGGTQTIAVGENKTFGTYIVNPTNTTANTFGDRVVKASNSSAIIQIPVQTYNLGLSATLVPHYKNYTVGSQLSSVSGQIEGIGGVSSIAAKGLTSPSISELDSSFAGATNTVPVIVIGGSAINTLGAELLNSSTPVVGKEFTNMTGVGSGEALIEMYSSVKAFGNQSALWVAGYGASDTLEASEVLAASLLGEPVVSLTGNKVILSTSSASYTGVSIVSTNSTA